MRELFKKINEIKKKYPSENKAFENRHCIALQCCKEYPNIPIDIMEYFFVRHSAMGEKILTGIADVLTRNISVSEKFLSSQDLMDEAIITFAPFVRNEDRKLYNILRVEESCNTFFPSGTWDFPIITINQNNVLLVIDGTTRFRNLLSYLKSGCLSICDRHKVYVLEST